MFKDKSILVIGGTGTIGQALVNKLISQSPKVIRILSRDEYKQYQMQQKLEGLRNIRFLLGDVRDKERLYKAMHRIDVVFDLAALKHVPSCEYNPFEAVKTNVMGTQNVIECSIENEVKRVIYASSDKAVSPTNTMGATKLLAERLIASADYWKGGKTPIFAAVRFGNVIGSRGSAIPLWEEQILNRREITVTDPDMTRFMISIDSAVDLTLRACEIAKGGEIFVLKMPAVRLGDLAEAVIEKVCGKAGIPVSEVNIRIIGLRPGEKMYEELMTRDEAQYAVEYEDMYAIPPLYNQMQVNIENSKNCNSSNYTRLNKKDLMELVDICFKLSSH
ncbi:MAG TPA: polysaccharide biosynthesis protein [Bacillota bacterium]|jgi:UDP-N-acetylglucosamine 4,6-dehydratase|nr:polysaccharide biosynthesis protein [Bacillota bacterium]HRS20197.1 polysaccharide biosynthesis protein [Clostridia bacterium]HRU42200.1 polysaccharide biosynthesis protein [Candidatus Diapherotrites archaeon]